ncbi:MAG: hypothetical protein K0Q73_6707 [Paenibacillus sp.]|nr:hypothetical protein [Paenibacillus sp.]
MKMHKLAIGTLKMVKEFKHAQGRRSDLDNVAFEILMLVKQRKQIRLTDIACQLDFNPSSITRRVQALKKSGHISMESDPKDLRSTLIGLTDAGEEVLLRYLEKSIDGLKGILKEWPVDEIQVLAEMLERFADAMSERRIVMEQSKGVLPDDADQ